ncbi:hypothetical protein C0991_011431 [Blastosporella zonata]|nr:hypothetical protein C0991_011431 [Blastosporella zonata]
MSEYWVSKKKYFCKYCDIYIADDAPSRQQHETGLRHKGNVDRFIRGLYKAGEKRKKDQDEEKRELARVEQAAQAAYAQDVAAGRARPGAGPVASTSATPKKPTPKPSNPYANYSTAASLGFSDPDAERIAAEAERRRTQGVAGEWEVVATITPTLAPSSDDENEKPDVNPPTGDATIGVKREAETPADEEDTRAYKLRKKGWGSGMSGAYDPDAIPIKLKKKQEEVEPEPAPVEPASTSLASEIPTTPGALKWTKVQWRKAGEAVPKSSAPETRRDPSEETLPAEASESSQVTVLPLAHEIETLPAPIPLIEEVKHTQVEESPPTPEPSTAGMFRKRKVPAGGNRGRRP